LVSGPLASVLSSQQPADFAAILDRPAIVELALIGDDEQKCLLMGALLVFIAEVRISGGASTVGHLLVIEEAHRLLRQASTHLRDDSANSRGQAVDAFTSLAAEMRAFRQGVGVVEQSPIALHREVLTNSNLKIAFRLPDAQNLDWISNEFDFDPAQRRQLAFAGPGQCVVLGAGMRGAYMVRFPNLRSIRFDVMDDPRPSEDDIDSSQAAGTVYKTVALSFMLSCCSGEWPASMIEYSLPVASRQLLFRTVRETLRDKGVYDGLALQAEDQLAILWCEFLRVVILSPHEARGLWLELNDANSRWEQNGSGAEIASGLFEARRLASLIERSREAAAVSVAARLPEKARILLKAALEAHV
jgi:hypothetical protein